MAELARIAVQAGDFSLDDEIARMTDGRADVGGLGSFVGTVRGVAKGRPITAMTLEHYPGMTERAMARIAGGAMQRWDLLGCTLIHRVGALLPGERIVLVLAAAAHRQACLEATAYLIDWLKVSAPFWKKESFLDGTEEWVDAREADDAAVGRWGGV